MEIVASQNSGSGSGMMFIPGSHVVTEIKCQLFLSSQIDIDPEQRHNMSQNIHKQIFIVGLIEYSPGVFSGLYHKYFCDIALALGLLQ